MTSNVFFISEHFIYLGTLHYLPGKPYLALYSIIWYPVKSVIWYFPESSIRWNFYIGVYSVSGEKCIRVECIRYIPILGSDKTPVVLNLDSLKTSETESLREQNLETHSSPKLGT